MYEKIMVPVDLAHIERLQKAINTAIGLAKHYRAPVLFVGVTAEPPTEVALWHHAAGSSDLFQFPQTVVRS